MESKKYISVQPAHWERSDGITTNPPKFTALVTLAKIVTTSGKKACEVLKIKIGYRSWKWGNMFSPNGLLSLGLSNLWLLIPFSHNVLKGGSYNGTLELVGPLCPLFGSLLFLKLDRLVRNFDKTDKLTMVGKIPTWPFLCFLLYKTVQFTFLGFLLRRWARWLRPSKNLKVYKRMQELEIKVTTDWATCMANK